MDGILGKIAAESFKIISMKNTSHKMNILVTGASGFLGFHVIKELQDRGYANLIAPRSSEYDLRNQEHLDSLFSSNSIDVVIHLAAVVGGIGANQNNPGTFFYDNAIMGIQLLEAARRYSVKKTVIVVPFSLTNKVCLFSNQNINFFFCILIRKHSVKC